MASTICAFCSNYTSRFFICQSCLTTYNRELGVGWEKQEWAIEFIRLHRQQVTAQNREDQRTVYLDDERTLPEDTHTVVVSRFEPNSSLLDDLVLSFGKQAFGSKKITQLIQAQG